MICYVKEGQTQISKRWRTSDFTLKERNKDKVTLLQIYYEKNK